jgi:hypothetical protein
LHIHGLADSVSALSNDIVSLATNSHLFPCSTLDPFVLCLLVSFSRLKKLNEPILDGLRAAFVGQLKQAEAMKVGWDFFLHSTAQSV